MDPTLWSPGSYLGVSIRNLVVYGAGYFRNTRGGGLDYVLQVVGHSGLGYLKTTSMLMTQCQCLVSSQGKKGDSRSPL